MTDAQTLYNVLDRLVHASIISREDVPDNRYSPLGQALYVLHRLDFHTTEDCVCAKQFAIPPA
ncbi:hypothetical protein [Sphingopyxis sp. 22461]|uniref:hypothetical protein n=1 Tax=Sphingopyxis sp. 22461 TaxID=3453923 RepID=UPI003F8591CF